VQGQDVDLRQHVVEPGMKDRALFQIRRKPVATVVMHFHVETTSPFRHHAADPAHADDPEFLARRFNADHEGGTPEVPAVLAHHLVALAGASRCAEHAQNRDLGSR